MAFTLITVTRRYLSAGLTPATGTVRFTPSAPMNNGDTVIAASRVGTLDAAGDLTIVLAANNDPTTTPIPVSYEVREDLDGQATRTYFVTIPYNAAGGTVALSSLNAAAVPPVVTYPAPGPAGPNRIATATDFSATGAVGQVVAATAAAGGAATGFGLIALPTVLLAGAGIDPTGATTSTAAVQAILDSVAADGGGRVTAPAGVYLVGPLTVGPRTVIEGVGAKSVFKLAAASAAACFSLKAATNERTVLRNFVIDGNKVNQTSAAAGGINWVNGTDWTAIANASTAAEGDPRHLFENLLIHDVKGDGLAITGRGETRGHNVQVQRADGVGFRIDSPDGFWNQCSSGESGLEGWVFTSGANGRFVNCKAFFAGRITVARGDGFSVQSNRVELIGCEAQDNKRHGFYIGAFTRVLAAGCTADSNGTATTATAGVTQGDGFYLDGCSYCVIDGQAFDRIPNQPPAQAGVVATQRYGVQFASSAQRNTVHITGTGNVTGLNSDPFLNLFQGPGVWHVALLATSVNAVEIYSGTRTASDPAYVILGNRARIGYSGVDVYLDDNGAGRDVAIRRSNAETGRFDANGITMGAAKVVRTGRAVTASRPAAATVGAGSMFFDTTLNRPIWSNGTAWVDSAGVAV